METTRIAPSSLGTAEPRAGPTSRILSGVSLWLPAGDPTPVVEVDPGEPLEPPSASRMDLRVRSGMTWEIG